MRRCLALSFLLSLLLILAPSALAKNCTKGKPCGNTCINVNYTCRVGTSSNTAPRTTTPRPAAPPPPRTTAQVFSPQSTLQGPVRIVRFVDGDTVRLMVNGIEENVRLIGIDTPETKHPTLGVQPFGPEASEFTRRLLAGHDVWVEFDVAERDHYRRPLVYLYYAASDGDWTYQGMRLRQANLEITRQGWADTLTIAPNVRYSDLYVLAVRQAREGGLGMWVEATTGAQAQPVVQTNGADRDCSDFSTRAEAQSFFEAAGPGDPHRLDADGDRLACESLR
jgi:micrococcal nuclease